MIFVYRHVEVHKAIFIFPGHRAIVPSIPRCRVVDRGGDGMNLGVILDEMGQDVI